MTKFFTKCFSCKKTKFIVRNRRLTLPTGVEVLSQKMFCGQCNTKLQKTLNLTP